MIAAAQAPKRLVSSAPPLFAVDTHLFAKQVFVERDRLIRDGIFDHGCKVIVRSVSEFTVSDPIHVLALALERRDDGVLAMHFALAEAQCRPDESRRASAAGY
ncbi:hypothetical protein [Ensifer adhaerens]|uniref:hypothetical protein n=1 Tax=Ensifer adhaerens TaxID=106592 RepID=UPI001C4E22CA|nr:hypothetical protein [Ensifer adhaerens]MBW0366641.1 hypothetical protein [Ensifer adhaerens]UCM18414.1 hypothetical protein LDL63_11160 [Ensifer adhaerens]